MKRPKYVNAILREKDSSKSIEDRLRDKLEKAEREVLQERRRSTLLEELLAQERQMHAITAERLGRIWLYAEGRPVNGRG